MAYYLKKTKLKGLTYLSIDESFYSQEKKGTAHKCYKSLGSVETLIKNGMADPVSFYQQEVDRLNSRKKQDGVPMISERSPFLFSGYFPLKSILERLDVRKYVSLFSLTSDFKYDLYSVLSSLIYARSVNPCSKRRTFHEVLPYLFEPHDFSYDQMMDALSFLGANYEKFVEIFNVQVSRLYGLDTSMTGHLSKRDVHDNGLFQDSEPEQGTQPPRRGLPLTDAQRDGTLPNPMAAAR